MLARLQSASIRGLDAEAVDVEVDLSRGLPCWNLVGLPEASVREARDRVRSAVVNSGFEFPLRRITVNLAPADLRKDGSHFDLSIAIGLLLASGQLRAEGAKLLDHAMQRFSLSARSYHRILKVARTIADLAGAEHVAAPHIAEALQYRGEGVGEN